MSHTPSIKEILQQSLVAQGFDGLYHPAQCACTTTHLIPCGELSPLCRAGYFVQRDTRDEATAGFTISPIKHAR